MSSPEEQSETVLQLKNLLIARATGDASPDHFQGYHRLRRRLIGAVRVTCQAPPRLIPLVRDMLPVGQGVQDSEQGLTGFWRNPFQKVE